MKLLLSVHLSIFLQQVELTFLQYASWIYLSSFIICALAATSKLTKCDGEDDCDEDECCIANYNPFQKGRCGKLGDKGRSCSSEEDKVDYFGGKYFHACPCEENLKCIPEKIITKGKSTYKQNPRCVEPTTSTSEEPTEEPEVTTGTEGGDSGEGGEGTDGGEGGEGTDGGERGEGTTGSEELVVKE